MDIKKFKKMIKEAVIEALYEELPDLVNESLTKFSRKQRITESYNDDEVVNFTSNDVIHSKTALPAEARQQLSNKMGSLFGFNQPQKQELKVIDAVDESTGQKVNPFLSFMEDTKNNLTPADISGLRNLD